MQAPAKNALRVLVAGVIEEITTWVRRPVLNANSGFATLPELKVALPETCNESKKQRLETPLGIAPENIAAGLPCSISRSMAESWAGWVAWK
jgi:hypothetical protein